MECIEDETGADIWAEELGLAIDECPDDSTDELAGECVEAEADTVPEA